MRSCAMSVKLVRSFFAKTSRNYKEMFVNQKRFYLFLFRLLIERKEERKVKKERKVGRKAGKR